MYELTIITEFEAAHCIEGYPGKCQRLHGHNWKVEVNISSEVLDDLGMVIDFRVLKQEVNTVIDKLDHYYLNEIDAFHKKNPTAEHIAKYIYDELAEKPAFSAMIQLQSIKVWESPRAAVLYCPGR